MTPSRRDWAIAALVTALALLETLVGPGGDGSRAVSAAAAAAATLPLAWRRTLPLLPLAAIAVALIAQAPLGGFLIGETATPLVALAIALYSCGRYLVGGPSLAAAALGVVIVSGTRVLVDPAAETPDQAALTFAAVALPLLVGRWVRAQALLQRRLAQQTQRLERDRARDARAAAEEERMRIAEDLQAAIAGSLRDIIDRAQELPSLLRAGEHAASRERLASVATTAREALADVRRVLGILRRDDERPRLTPPRTDTLADAPEPLRPQPEWADDRAATTDAPVLPSRARTLDRLLAGALLAGLELELAWAAGAGERLVAALTAVPIAAALLWRRQHPMTAAAAVLATIMLQSLLLDLDGFPLFDIAAVVAAGYAIGAYTPRRTAVVALGLFTLGVAAHAAVFYPDGVVAAVLGGVAGPWTVGRVVRGRRQLTQQGHDEAARAQRAHEGEARAAVTAERMQIARELHDAVAHNISVIAIQAGGADGIIERDPGRTADCAALIEAVAREALVELGRLGGALRTAVADRAPATQPSLARVDVLTARARAAGLPVELHVEGEPRELPAGLDLAAYRIVQEALANTAKHASAASASVCVRYDHSAVAVEVTDDGCATLRHAQRRNGHGHGLIGMRERVALYGGTLDVGRRPSGGFRVHARLPIRPA